MSLVSDKLRESAEGQECQVRIPGICNFNPETTILAHVARGSGMGQKCDDVHATFCCSSCHAEIDRVTRTIPKEQAELYALEGMVRTQSYWLHHGLIDVA